MKTYSFTPFPELFTARLQLRAFQPQDRDEIFFFRSDPRILEFIAMAPVQSINEADSFIDKITTAVKNDESIQWGINLKNQPKLIGTICLWNISEEENCAEIGYVLHPDFQGKGIMQESVEAVLDYGFKKMKLDFILAELSPDNIKSVRLLEKNNFIRTPSENNAETIQYKLQKTE